MGVPDLRGGRRVGARRAAQRRLVDAHEAVDALGAAERLVGEGCGATLAAGREASREGAAEGVLDEGALARAAHAGDAHEGVEGEAHLGHAQVVAARAPEHELLRERPRGRRGDGLAPRQPAPRRSVRGQERLGGADEHDLPARPPGAGAEVHHEVRRAHHVEVVLDDEHGVAGVAEVGEDGDEGAGVLRVEARGGLVEDVEHARELVSGLRGEAEALELAAGEGGGAAVEREVAEAGAEEEVEAAPELLLEGRDDGAGWKVRHEGTEVGEGERGDLGERALRDPHRARHRTEPGAVAGLAGALLDRDATLLLGERERALKARGERGLGGIAVEDQVPLLPRELPPRHVHRDAARGDRGLERLLHRALPPLHRALRERAVGVGHEAVGVDPARHAEALAVGAGADGRVEREQARRGLGEVQIAGEAAENGGERAILAVHLRDQRALPDAQRAVDGLLDAVLAVGRDLDAVDDDVDVVGLAGVHRGDLVEGDGHAVHPNAREALTGEAVDERLQAAGAAAGERRADDQPGADGESEEGADDRVRRGARDGASAARAVGGADAGPEHAEELVDLGEGADGGARRGRDEAALGDADARREPGEQLVGGLSRRAELLAHVARQRFDEAALGLGVQRVERERGLAAAGGPREDEEALAREVEVDGAEVVFARAADLDGDGAGVVRRHGART
jgi:hypothetical protein